MTRLLAVVAAVAVLGTVTPGVADPGGRQVPGPYASATGSGRAPCLQMAGASHLSTRYKSFTVDSDTGQLDYRDELESPAFGLAPGLGCHFDSASVSTSDTLAPGREIRRFEVTVDVIASAWHTGIRSRDIEGVPPREPAGESSATLAFVACGRVVRIKPLVSSWFARAFQDQVTFGIDFEPGECAPSEPVGLKLESSIDVKLAQQSFLSMDHGSGPDNGSTGVELQFKNPVFRAYDA